MIDDVVRIRKFAINGSFIGRNQAYLIGDGFVHEATNGVVEAINAAGDHVAFSLCGHNDLRSHTDRVIAEHRRIDLFSRS